MKGIEQGIMQLTDDSYHYAIRQYNIQIIMQMVIQITMQVNVEVIMQAIIQVIM